MVYSSIFPIFEIGQTPNLHKLGQIHSLQMSCVKSGCTHLIFSVTGIGLLGSESVINADVRDTRNGSMTGSSSQYVEAKVGARREITRTSPPEQKPAKPISLHLSRFSLKRRASLSITSRFPVRPTTVFCFGIA